MLLNIKAESGFTLIEVLIALCVLAVGILTLQAMQISSIKGNVTANRISIGAAWATDMMEQIYVKPYRDTTLTCANDPMCDTDSDGTNQDPDRDAIDTVGADLNFGLNDEGAAADHTAISPDNVYTIYWNIAEDYPIPNNKTVRVIVISNQQGTTRRVVYDYVKTDTI